MEQKAKLSVGEMEELGEKTTSLSARIEAATVRLLEYLHEFDESGGWRQQGAKSCGHWLSWRTNLDLRAAQERVRVARVLAQRPQLKESYGKGELSYSKVRAITRVVTDDSESKLVELGRHSTAAQMEKICRAYQRVTVPKTPQELEARRYVHRVEGDGGLVKIQMQLLPEEAALFMEALHAIRDEHWKADQAVAKREVEEGGGDASTVMVKQISDADAVMELCEKVQEGESVPFQLVMSVSQETVTTGEGQGHLPDGTPVAAKTAQRLACHGETVSAFRGTSTGATNAQEGRRSRVVPPRLKRLLAQRDEGCRFPGCTHTRFVDAHHIVPWAQGGATQLNNLVQMCRSHHRFVHEHDYEIRMKEGQPAFFHPGGWELESRFERNVLVEMARERNEPLKPEPPPTWDGTHLDLGLAVSGLIS